MKKIAWLLASVLGLGISLFAEDMGKAGGNDWAAP
jgi:hypothetical protein